MLVRQFPALGGRGRVTVQSAQNPNHQGSKDEASGDHARAQATGSRPASDDGETKNRRQKMTSKMIVVLASVAALATATVSEEASARGGFRGGGFHAASFHGGGWRGGGWRGAGWRGAGWRTAGWRGAGWRTAGWRGAGWRTAAWRGGWGGGGWGWPAVGAGVGLGLASAAAYGAYGGYSPYDAYAYDTGFAGFGGCSRSWVWTAFGWQIQTRCF
jgi:hypothetical protein